MAIENILNQLELNFKKTLDKLSKVWYNTFMLIFKSK